MATRKRTYAASLGRHKLYRPAKVVRTTTYSRPTQTARLGRYKLRRNLRTAGYLGIENKFFDTSLVNTALSAPSDCTGGEVDPATALCLTVPAVGDGEQNRDGKQICGKYLVIKGKVATTVSEVQTDPTIATEVYLACVLDTQTNGAQLNSEDVFKNTAANASIACHPLKNLLFGKRFKILKDGTFNLSNPSIAFIGANAFAVCANVRYFNWYIPLRNLKFNFNGGTTSAIANVIDNSVHLIAYTSSTQQAPFISYQARFRFIG